MVRHFPDRFFASDNLHRLAEVGDAEPRLRRVAMDSADLPMSVTRPVTKYERKALAGPVVTELLWERTQ